jgi:hypothetical protein
MDILFAMTAADLTPDALAKLEAKLVADLEMVRKVRALLEEHQLGGGMAAAPSGATAKVVAPVPVFTPKAPERPREEVLKECLAETAGRPFAPQEKNARHYVKEFVTNHSFTMYYIGELTSSVAARKPASRPPRQEAAKSLKAKPAVTTTTTAAPPASKPSATPTC